MAKRSVPQSKPARIGRFAGKLVLLGAGNMGGAMLAGWIARGLSPKKIVVLEPKPAPSVKALTRKGLILNPAKLPKDIAAIVVAIKPQAAPDILPQIAPVAGKAMIVSIMAGRTIGFLESMVSRSSPVVRAMPNLPASVGRGITVAAPNDNVSRAQRAFATGLLAAVGAVEWVEDEKLMDAVTATSGSGPAYVFLLAETMTRAAVAAGLSAELAARLVRETIAGAGELLRQSPLDAATLRKNVTSPGGTTAAALDVLMGPDGMEKLMTRAVAAATQRSKDQAK
jgi:pyrroline-5-carboxylate reductase